jgi:hypothetical protein
MPHSPYERMWPRSAGPSVIRDAEVWTPLMALDETLLDSQL